MAWVKLDERFTEHPKLALVGPLGLALWVTGLAYCNRNLTDGFIPWALARTLISWEFLEPSDGDTRGRRHARVCVSSGRAGDDVTSDYVIELLLSAGLWEETDGGYLVHDYDNYQPLKAEVLAEHEAKVAAGRKGGKRSTGIPAQAPAQAPAPAHAQAEFKQTLSPNPVSESDDDDSPYHPPTGGNGTGPSVQHESDPDAMAADDQAVVEQTHNLCRRHGFTAGQVAAAVDDLKGRRGRGELGAISNWPRYVLAMLQNERDRPATATRSPEEDSKRRIIASLKQEGVL